MIKVKLTGAELEFVIRSCRHHTLNQLVDMYCGHKTTRDMEELETLQEALELKLQAALDLKLEELTGLKQLY